MAIQHPSSGLLTREQIIQVARRRHGGESEILRVLEVAKATDDRHLLGICLDCFRSVLEDSVSDAACEVVKCLGQLLDDPAYRRIRRRILWTAFWIGDASRLILPQLVRAFTKPRSASVIRPARCAVVSVAWRSLAQGDPSERARALEAFEQIGPLGLLNLRHYLRTENPGPAVQSEIESAIRRLEARNTGR